MDAHDETSSDKRRESIRMYVPTICARTNITEVATHYREPVMNTLTLI